MVWGQGNDDAKVLSTLLYSVGDKEGEETHNAKIVRM